MSLEQGPVVEAEPFRVWRCTLCAERDSTATTVGLSCPMIALSALFLALPSVALPKRGRP